MHERILTRIPLNCRVSRVVMKSEVLLLESDTR